jgi:hypothetical protein
MRGRSILREGKLRVMLQYVEERIVPALPDAAYKVVELVRIY